MGKLVDLTARPYFLSAEQIDWVEQTIAGMTDEFALKLFEENKDLL